MTAHDRFREWVALYAAQLIAGGYTQRSAYELHRLVGEFPARCDRCDRFLHSHHNRCKTCREAA